MYISLSFSLSLYICIAYMSFCFEYLYEHLDEHLCDHFCEHLCKHLYTNTFTNTFRAAPLSSAVRIVKEFVKVLLELNVFVVVFLKSKRRKSGRIHHQRINR